MNMTVLNVSIQNIIANINAVKIKHWNLYRGVEYSDSQKKEDKTCKIKSISIIISKNKGVA